MVGPVSSGIQQQLPIANTFQPGDSSQVQGNEKKRDNEETRRAGTPFTQSQKSETRNNGQSQGAALTKTAQNGNSGGSQGRGSVVDLTV